MFRARTAAIGHIIGTAFIAKLQFANVILRAVKSASGFPVLLSSAQTRNCARRESALGIQNTESSQNVVALHEKASHWMGVLVSCNDWAPGPQSLLNYTD